MRRTLSPPWLVYLLSLSLSAPVPSGCVSLQLSLSCFLSSSMRLFSCLFADWSFSERRDPSPATCSRWLSLVTEQQLPVNRICTRRPGIFCQKRKIQTRFLPPCCTLSGSTAKGRMYACTAGAVKGNALSIHHRFAFTPPRGPLRVREHPSIFVSFQSVCPPGEAARALS